jgi:hypothetical protein
MFNRFSGSSDANQVDGHEYVNVTLQSPSHATPRFDENFSTEMPRLPPKPAHALPPKPLPSQTSVSNVVSADSIDISIVEREASEKSMASPTTQLNYAQLDLNRNESPLSPPHSVTGEMFPLNLLSSSRRNTLENVGSACVANGCPQEYAVIDFDRTNALNDVAKLQSQRSLEAGIVVGVRKTRHH